MGEIPTPVWGRYLNSCGRASSEPQKWFTTKQNWTEMCNVESYSELGVRNEELGVGNGQSIYDLSGRKVKSQLQKGNIYILNGKKVKR